MYKRLQYFTVLFLVVLSLHPKWLFFKAQGPPCDPPGSYSRKPCQRFFRPGASLVGRGGAQFSGADELTSCQTSKGQITMTQRKEAGIDGRFDVSSSHDGTAHVTWRGTGDDNVGFETVRWWVATGEAAESTVSESSGREEAERQVQTLRSGLRKSFESQQNTMPYRSTQ